MFLQKVLDFWKDSLLSDLTFRMYQKLISYGYTRGVEKEMSLVAGKSHLHGVLSHWFDVFGGDDLGWVGLFNYYVLLINFC